SQWVADGVGCVTAARWLALGGYGAITGASTAASTQESTMPVPMRAGFDSAMRPRRRAHARASPRRTGAEAAGRRSAVDGSVIQASRPDARVEQPVGEIARDLGQDRDAHGDERPNLHEGDVLEEGCLEHHPAEARIREHRL